MPETAAETAADGPPLGAEDRSALRALVDGYAVTADERDRDGFAALFTPDAVLRVFPVSSARTGRYEGTVELATVPAALEKHFRTLHLVTTHLARATGPGEATGVTYCEAHHVTVDGGDRILAIRYEDRYRRSPDGWRIAARDVRVQWVEERDALEVGAGRG